MHLWTEYEGATIADAYPLRKLLRSEGRSAFFATSTDADRTAVIRLTEAHFDEDEMLQRWREVSAVHQANLIGIQKTGSTVYDGVALTYALMEPEDASLDDVLRERPLTAAETQQVGRSVAAALRALHEHDLVHGNVQAASVFAVGETVKLRSDCVRPCVPDGEFSSEEDCARMRQEDVHALGVLLLRCLTLNTELQPGAPLAEPFRSVIPRAVDGSWTLAQIEDKLDPKPAVAPRSIPATLPSAAAPAKDAASRMPASPTRPATTSVPATPAVEKPAVSRRVREASIPAVPPPSAPMSSLPLFEAPAEQPETASMPDFASRRSSLEEESSVPFTAHLRWVYAAAAVLVVLLLWHFIGSRKAAPTAANTTAGPVASAPVAQAPAPRAAAAPMQTTTAYTSTQHGWYAIAYTYHRQADAAAMAAHIATRHATLAPQVIQPGGRGPYLVALGGAMSKAAAVEMRSRARHAGMPRDTFIRNY